MGQKGSKEVNESCLRPHHPHKCSDVDLRKLKALIKQGKLAPCFPPEEEENDEVLSYSQEPLACTWMQLRTRCSRPSSRLGELFNAMHNDEKN